MKRSSVFVIAAASSSLRNPRPPGALCNTLKLGAATSTLLALSGCYYTPYGYGPYYSGTVPIASTQQETIAQNSPNPAPAAMPDAQYPGPLYPSPPVAIAVPAWSAYPAYAPYPAYYPAYPYPAWGWGAPAVSFGFGYWGGGWHH